MNFHTDAVHSTFEIEQEDQVVLRKLVDDLSARKSGPGPARPRSLLDDAYALKKGEDIQQCSTSNLFPYPHHASHDASNQILSGEELQIFAEPSRPFGGIISRARRQHILNSEQMRL